MISHFNVTLKSDQSILEWLWSRLKIFRRYSWIHLQIIWNDSSCFEMSAPTTGNKNISQHDVSAHFKWCDSLVQYNWSHYLHLTPEVHWKYVHMTPNGSMMLSSPGQYPYLRGKFFNTRICFNAFSLLCRLRWAYVRICLPCYSATRLSTFELTIYIRLYWSHYWLVQGIKHM